VLLAGLCWASPAQLTPNIPTNRQQDRMFILPPALRGLVLAIPICWVPRNRVKDAQRSGPPDRVFLNSAGGDVAIVAHYEEDELD